MGELSPAWPDFGSAIGASGTNLKSILGTLEKLYSGHARRI
ncbi:hypothetical protein [Arthrobacter sp. Marseille-P9274]|nr:hypothetical protein [Arthrobacter sp. Marseille-P9274]